MFIEVLLKLHLQSDSISLYNGSWNCALANFYKVLIWKNLLWLRPNLHHSVVGVQKRSSTMITFASLSFYSFWFVRLLLQVLYFSSPTKSNSSPSTFYLDGTPNSYLQFASWHHFFSKKNFSQPEKPNHQASISFEFQCSLVENAQSNGGPVGGLLFYSDDQTGIGGVFIEVKLLSETNLRIRIDDNSGIRVKNIIELRQEINFTDGQWHRFELIRHFQPTSQKLEYGSIIDSEDLNESITVKVRFCVSFKVLVFFSSLIL